MGLAYTIHKLAHMDRENYFSFGEIKTSRRPSKAVICRDRVVGSLSVFGLATQINLDILGKLEI
jgi:hypothetical protein